jgi:hypothetical protein
MVFDAALNASGVPMPVMEHQFCQGRKWRFDYAWPLFKVALEQDGGVWRKGGGAHTGVGHIRDIEKGNQAVRLGWRVLHIVPENLCRLETVELVKESLGLCRAPMNASGEISTLRVMDCSGKDVTKTAIKS